MKECFYQMSVVLLNGEELMYDYVNKIEIENNILILEYKPFQNSCAKFKAKIDLNKVDSVHQSLVSLVIYDDELL